MCESLDEGGRRCLDYRRLSALSAAEVAPAHREDVPDVLWIKDDLPLAWDGLEGEGHQALGASIDRLLTDRAVEPAITDALLDGLPSGAQMHGLEARMKSPTSTAGKVPRKRRGEETARETVARFTDTLRYTVCTSEHDGIVPAARSVLAGVTARGMQVVEAMETYSEGASYKGLHFLVRTPEGTTFELQVHSELSQGVKDVAHPDYEISRDPEADLDEAQDAQTRCVERYEAVPTPAGLKDVETFEGCPLQRL